MCDVLNPTNILNIESYFFIKWCVIIKTLQKLYIKPLQHICSRHFKFYLNHISKLIINFNYVLFCSSDFIFVVLSLLSVSLSPLQPTLWRTWPCCPRSIMLFRGWWCKPIWLAKKCRWRISGNAFTVKELETGISMF